MVADYTQQETVTLTPLPCWKGLSSEDYRTRIEELVQLVVSEAEAERAQTGKEPLGPEAIRRQKSAEYREASEKLRAGDRNVRFPLGCFPPGLPFVSEATVPA